MVRPSSSGGRSGRWSCFSLVVMMFGSMRNPSMSEPVIPARMILEAVRRVIVGSFMGGRLVFYCVWGVKRG